MKQLRGVCRKDNWAAVNLTKDRSPEGGCKQRRFGTQEPLMPPCDKRLEPDRIDWRRHAARYTYTQTHTHIKNGATFELNCSPHRYVLLDFKGHEVVIPLSWLMDAS